MRNTFKILFYIKRNAVNRTGNVPIMGRITITGGRSQFATQLHLPPAMWDVRLGRAAGRGAAAGGINERLEVIRHQIERCYNTLFSEHIVVTPLMVKELYFGEGHRRESILAFFTQHNEQFGRMVGINRCKSTYYKYRCVALHLERFICETYRRRDLSFKELDHDFLIGFHGYISRECGCRKNTTWVYMIAFKHILMLARGRGLLTQDLFANYKLHSESVTRNYLSADELSQVIALQLSDASHHLIRDAFIFSCFTGLSYVDVRHLTPQHIQLINNQLWVATTRQKTGSDVNVRLFALPYAILLRRMATKPDASIFPIPSNGWCNICLEKIMLQAGIAKHITFHAARHTFATTITLSQGMAIETISKLLGHKNIRTTQIYATITHTRLNAEMESLSKRIDAQWGAENEDKNVTGYNL